LNVPGAELVIRTNLLGPMYAFEAVLPAMLARGSGHLVGNLERGVPERPADRGRLLREQGRLQRLPGESADLVAVPNVAVTAILPGFVRTEMTAKTQG